MAAFDASKRGGRDVDELLRQLDLAAKTPAKSRSVKINGLVENLCSSAYQDGLTTASLSKLVDIITLPNELDQASLGGLIKNLYPAEKVPDSIVINIVASLGHGKAKPSHNVQFALLNWLVLVHDVLANPKVLSQLYAVLFNLLDTLALRTPLCHLLSLITRRKHVRPYRIQVLMELTRQLGGNEAPVVGLLRVYKDYYPDVILGDILTGKVSMFKPPDHEWRQRLLAIQSITKSQDRESSKGVFSVSRHDRTTRRRTRSSIIPEVHTSNASENSTTIEEIDSISDFVLKLERIELPNQLIAVIKHPVLQRLLQLRSSDEHSKRINLWLLSFFEDQLQDPVGTDAIIMDTLKDTLDYVRFTKVLPSACLSYLKAMLPTWNGVGGRGIILDLLSYMPLGSFNEIYENVFQLVEYALLQNDSSDCRKRLLLFYRDVLDHWTVLALSHPSSKKDAISSIASLIDRAIILSLAVSQASPNQEGYHAILCFYDSVTATISNPDLKWQVPITTLASELVYVLHFTSSLCTLSQLCSILASYKRAFEVIKSNDKDSINNFNGYLMDVCNCIWRSRALNSSDPNALGCLIDPEVTSALKTYVTSLDSSLALPSLFSFSASPVFCLLAITYVRELEDSQEDSIARRHAGPVGQASLRQLEQDGGVKLSWQDYRLGVLGYLENIGVVGVGELIYNTMKHVMASRNKTVD